MKVLSIVSYKVFPAHTGGQRGIVLLEQYLARETPLVCATVRSNDPALAPYRILNILSDSPLRYINPLYFFTLRRIIRREQATHLLLEHPYYGWLGVLLKKLTGIRLAVRSHNIEATRWKSLGKWWWRLLHLYERFTLRHTDFNLFIHEHDLQYALQHYGLSPSRCLIATYGLEWNTLPPREERRAIQQHIRQQYGIDEADKILLFNGAFRYQPNLDALNALIGQVNPLLQQKKDFRYKILICGIHLPDGLSRQSHPNIIMAGFVEDIGLYFKAADVFLNPVVDGGGIKTKLVEALGYNCNVVSAENGAIGVDPQLCNGKLLIVENARWQAFADAIPVAAAMQADIPPAFFDHFYWGNIAKKMVQFFGSD